MSGPSRRYRVRFAKLATALRFRRYQLDALEFCTWQRLMLKRLPRWIVRPTTVSINAVTRVSTEGESLQLYIIGHTSLSADKLGWKIGESQRMCGGFSGKSLGRVNIARWLPLTTNLLPAEESIRTIPGYQRFNAIVDDPGSWK